MSPFSGLICEIVDSVGQENLTVVSIVETFDCVNLVP